MYILNYFIFFAILWKQSVSQELYESDMNFRVEAGSRTCFFERGEVGQVMEAKYQVIDGQHGDYDISFEVVDPNGVMLVNDYKQSHNSIIMDLEVAGDYVFCLDNTHSVINSKLVFVYVLMEDKEGKTTEEATVSAVEDGVEKVEQEVLEWMGHNKDGEAYYVEVAAIAESVTKTLRNVVKARHALNMYGALKSRDSYLAFEDTFIVDMWSAFQIGLMCVVGTVQVYMIKKLFTGSSATKKPFY